MRCWLVWHGEHQQLVNLRDGVFLKGDLGAFGEAGASYVRNSLPLFNVPWRVKAALDAADIYGSTALDAPVLRYT